MQINPSFIKTLPLWFFISLWLTGCRNSGQIASQSLVGQSPEKPLITETAQSLGACLGDHKTQTASVVRVIDGDTIEVKLEGKIERVRYLMIDTPEMDAKDPRPGELAKEFNEKLVEGKTVQLTRDTNDRDDFGRLLRFVSVDDTSINLDLVENGYATTFIRPPDTKCSDEFTHAMLAAYNARIGIWQNYPKTDRYKDGCPNGCEQTIKGCDIKGNINTLGDKIFHLPDTKDYANVKIDPKYGERWFCTIDAAIANGWRPPRAE